MTTRYKIRTERDISDVDLRISNNEQLNKTFSYYGDGSVHVITYSNGDTATFTYNGDGTIATKVYVLDGKTATYSYTWVAGSLTTKTCTIA